MFAFNHFNFNVTDLERSIAFYHDALGLEPVRRKEAADGSFILTFLGLSLIHISEPTRLLHTSRMPSSA